MNRFCVNTIVLFFVTFLMHYLLKFYKKSHTTKCAEIILAIGEMCSDAVYARDIVSGVVVVSNNGILSSADKLSKSISAVNRFLVNYKGEAKSVMAAINDAKESLVMINNFIKDNKIFEDDTVCEEYKDNINKKIYDMSLIVAQQITDYIADFGIASIPIEELFEMRRIFSEIYDTSESNGHEFIDGFNKCKELIEAEFNRRKKS